MASFRKKRARKVQKPAKARPQRTIENDEDCLHLHCWQWVKKEYPTLLIFHVANEREAPVQFHVKLKRKGVLAGVADFLAFPTNSRKIAIELKDDKGEQDEEQIRFQKRWEHSGGFYCVVRTLDGFKTVIEAAVMFG